MSIPKEDYVTTIFVKDVGEVQVGMDDNGQQYYFQYVTKDGVEQEVGCGAYNTDYRGFIEYYFAPRYSYMCEACGHVWTTTESYATIKCECVRCGASGVIRFDDQRLAREKAAAKFDFLKKM